MKNLLYIIAVVMLLTSCEKDKILPSEDNNINSNVFKREFKGDSILLQNPYSVERMTHALNILKSQNQNSQFNDLANFSIPITHLYIKFHPKNAEEEGLLKKDSTLILFDYRLDCEYKESYLNNRAPENDSIPDYYTSITIEKSKNLPNVSYDVIDKLYIPEQDQYFKDVEDIDKYEITYKIENKTDLFNHLIFEAFEETGNEEELIESQTENQKWIFGKKWRPAGNLRVNNPCATVIYKSNDPTNNLTSTYTNDPDILPLEGAKVLIRQWFTVDSGITDSNGHFSTGTVRGKARYIIQWERYHYSIRSGWFGQAELRGPEKKAEDWNYDITDEEDRFRAFIHLAAHHYYYGDIHGLRRPPLNGFWRPQTKIGAFNQSNNSINGITHCWTRTFGILPVIRIYNPQHCSRDVYATTIHELAHYSHWNMGSYGYNHCDDKMTESWARGVQWELTKMKFPNYDIFYYSSSPNYTLLVKDLIDEIGQTTSYDQVTGYSIKQIEDQLQYETHWNGWKDKLKNNYANATENNLDSLFDYWWNH